MPALEARIQHRFASLDLSMAVELPGGKRLGVDNARLTIRLAQLKSVMHLATGQVGRLAEAFVEGHLDVVGSMRDLMDNAARLIDSDPTQNPPSAPQRWWNGLLRQGRSLARHRADADARQVEFHSTCRTISTRSGSIHAGSTPAPTLPRRRCRWPRRRRPSLTTSAAS